MIVGHREEFRFGERVLAGMLGLAGPLLPRRWRLNPAPNIARALLDAALAPIPGVHAVEAGTMI